MSSIGFQIILNRKGSLRHACSGPFPFLQFRADLHLLPGHLDETLVGHSKKFQPCNQAL